MVGVVRSLLLAGALTSVIGFSHLLSRAYLGEVRLRVHVPRQDFSILRYLRTFRAYPLLNASNSTSALYPLRFRTRCTLSFPLANGLRLLALYLRFRGLQMVDLVDVGTTVKGLRGLVDGPIRRVSIVDGRSRGTLGASRGILRPNRRLVVRVINELIRGRRVAKVRRDPYRYRPFLLSPKWVVSLLLVIYGSRLVRGVPYLTLDAPILLPLSFYRVVRSEDSLQGLQRLQGVHSSRTVLDSRLPLVQLLRATSSLRGHELPNPVGPSSPGLVSLVRPMKGVVRRRLLAGRLEGVLCVRGVRGFGPLSWFSLPIYFYSSMALPRGL